MHHVEIFDSQFSMHTTSLTPALQAFGLFDIDGDGNISRREMDIALQKLGIRGVDASSIMPQYDASSIMPQYDANGDGQIDYQEFKVMMADE